MLVGGGRRRLTGSTVDRSKLGSLGELVPMKTIVAALKARVAAGLEPPGDPLLIEYDRYEKEYARWRKTRFVDIKGLKRLADLVKRRQRQGKKIDLKELGKLLGPKKQPAKKPASKYKTPPPPEPGALTGSEDERDSAKWLFKNKYIKVLLPDLQQYVPYIFDKVLLKSRVYLGLLKEWRDKFAVWKKRRRGPSPERPAVDLLFKHGCKQVSRLMPGFAKVIQKKVATDLDMMGDWDAEVDKAHWAKELGTGAPKANKDLKRDKEPRIVEICTVTHKQLEATLRKDLAILAGALQVKPSRGGDQIQPLSERRVAGRGPSRRGAARPKAPRRLFQGRTVARRPPRRGAKKRRSFLGAKLFARLGKQPGKRTSKALLTGFAKRIAQAKKNRSASPRIRRSAPSGADVIRSIRQQKARKQAVLRLMFKDMGGKPYNIDELKGETFHNVAKRLLSFYRRKGEVRNFAEAMTATKGKIKELGTKENRPDHPDAKEMDYHADGKVVDTRKHRELLRRTVEQWTYGYEYEQLSGHLGSASKRGYGRLLNDYADAERHVLEEFWADCEEIQAICEAPQGQREKHACLSCAARAVQGHCVDGAVPGKAGKRVCKGNHEVRFWDPTKGTRRKGTTAQDKDSNESLSTAQLGGNTFLNWLVLQAIEESQDWDVHRGHGVTDLEFYKTKVIEYLVYRRFLPNKETDPIARANSEGKQKLDALPITSWQRCVLWNPYHSWNPSTDKGNNLCDSPEKAKAQIDRGGKSVPWRDSRLFKMVLGHEKMLSYLHRGQKYYQAACRKKNVNCPKLKKEGVTNADRWFKGAKGSGPNKKKQLSDTGDAIGSMLGPVVGKLLGILLKAAGLDEMMKTLAQAAGLTPEQSADCEDPEYRREVMKLKPCTDDEIRKLTCKNTKRGCLLKVFAKNFVNVLESIIVMLGNKLVDWAVDLLRTALKGVKAALLSAAGSVPFAGGFLAILVDIAWELLMNFGAKMLLKGFVIAKLPGWLGIYDLAQKSIEKVFNNPIVSVVMGIILQLIDAAITYGNKGVLAIGIDTALNGIQLILQEKRQWFWFRALTYAKREMRRDGTGAEGQGLEEQLLGLARGMVAGFGAAIARRMDSDARDAFNDAVDDIKALLTPKGFGAFKQKLLSDPVKALVGLIGQKIGPVVIPIVTAFVQMPQWLKKMLHSFSAELAKTIDAVGKRNFNAKGLVGSIVTVLEEPGMHLLKKLPVGGALQRLILDAYSGLLSVLKDIDQLESKYLKKPWRIVKAVVDLTGNYVKSKVGDLIADPKLAPEKDLLTSAVGAILDVLGNEQERKRLFPAHGPNTQAILAKVAEILKPYASERLRGLLAGTGVEGLVETAVNALFGPDGPFIKGKAFFSDLGRLIARKAEALVASVLDAVKGLVTSGAKALGSGPAGKILGGLAKGLMGSLSGALSGRGGIQKLLSQGAAGVLKLARDALRPLLDALAPAPSRGAQAAPMNMLLRSILGGLLDFFGDPGSLSALVKRGASALGKLAKQVALGLKSSVKSLVARSLGDKDLSALAEEGIDGFFTLVSDPSRITRFGGKKVLDLLKVVGQRVFGFAKRKLLALVSRSQLGPAQAALQSLLGAVLDEVQRILGDPSRLRSLVEGGVQKLVGFVAGIFKQPIRELMQRVVPSSMKGVVGDVFGKVIGWISKIGDLAKTTVNDLLKKVGPALKGVLEGILRSVVPPDAWRAIQTAIAKVEAAVSNPAGLLKEAGAAARQAIDQVIAAVLVRIPDSGLRGLASSVVAMVRDLVSSGAAGDRLRRELGALLERLVDAGAQYLTSLLPAGPVQRLLRDAIDGLRSLLRAKGGLGHALGEKAAALWPGIQRTLVGTIRDVIDRFADGELGGVLKGLVTQVIGLVANPDRWKKLQKEGLGYLLARLLPVARELASGLLGRLDSGSSAMRPVVEGLFQAASDLFSNPKRLTRFAKNAVSELVSMGLQSVTPVVLRLVSQATGNRGIVDFLKSAMTEAQQMLADPAKLSGFLKLKAPKALGKLIAKARGLVKGLVAGVIRDKTLGALAKDAIAAVFDFVKRALEGGGRDLSGAAKGIVAKLIPAVGAMAKKKLLGLFPHHLKGLKEVLATGFDRLVTFGTELITKGKAAWDKLTGGGKLFGKLVTAVLSLLKGPITKGISYAPLRGLLERLLDAISNLLSDPPALVKALRSSTTAMSKLLPELEKVIGPFAQEVLVQPLQGFGRTVVEMLVTAGRDLLRKPKELQELIRLAGRDKKGLLRRIIGGLVGKLLDAMKGNDTLKAILQGGLDYTLKTVLK